MLRCSTGGKLFSPVYVSWRAPLVMEKGMKRASQMPTVSAKEVFVGPSGVSLFVQGSPMLRR